MPNQTIPKEKCPRKNPLNRQKNKEILKKD